MAKKIIEENFSKYKSKSDIIIKYFNDRRNELKKSLLRKYWHLQKSTDKYFTTTFRRRERDKMKIRKNNKKKEESFEKVKMAGELCQTHLISIIKSMTEKEKLNRQLVLTTAFVTLFSAASATGASLSLFIIRMECLICCQNGACLYNCLKLTTSCQLNRVNLRWATRKCGHGAKKTIRSSTNP